MFKPDTFAALVVLAMLGAGVLVIIVLTAAENLRQRRVQR